MQTQHFLLQHEDERASLLHFVFQDFANMKFGKSVCIINVGGTKYAFPNDVLKDFPLRRVSRLHSCSSEREVLEVCDDYDRERNEFFFDRHSEAFGFIMLYVKYGKLRFVPHMCELSFYNEMLYWGLESSHLDFCCQRRLDDRMSDTYTHIPEEERDEPRAKPDSRCAERMRRTFEEPTSSLAAQILASVSVIFVIVSMVILCASTLPDWKTAESNSVDEHRYTDSLEHPSGYLCSFYSCFNFLSAVVTFFAEDAGSPKGLWRRAGHSNDVLTFFCFQ